MTLNPEAKRTHLKEFWKQAMGGRPMVLVGASLGGAIALDFAHEFPEAVKKLVLIDAQGFIDGSGPGASLPPPLAKLGISVLGSTVSVGSWHTFDGVIFSLPMPSFSSSGCMVHVFGKMCCIQRCMSIKALVRKTGLARSESVAPLMFLRGMIANDIPLALILTP